MNTAFLSTLKCVYVGALSREDTYIEEVCEWVIRQDGTVTLDIYSYMLHDETKTYLESLDNSHIRFFSEGIEYHDIPQTLSQYHLGLILYKGNTLNYIHNAPNKLFEYLACDLDVWFPVEMVGCKPYCRDDAYPKILEIDFKQMESFQYADAINRAGLDYRPTEYSCEDALDPLLREISSEVRGPRAENLKSEV